MGQGGQGGSPVSLQLGGHLGTPQGTRDRVGQGGSQCPCSWEDTWGPWGHPGERGTEVGPGGAGGVPSVLAGGSQQFWGVPAGNTALLLSPPAAALPLLLLGELSGERAALPPGVLNILVGPPGLSRALRAHPEVTSVTFLGAPQVRRCHSDGR